MVGRFSRVLRSMRAEWVGMVAEMAQVTKPKRNPEQWGKLIVKISRCTVSTVDGKFSLKRLGVEGPL